MPKQGWLERQAVSVEVSIRKWPTWLRRVRGIEPLEDEALDRLKATMDRRQRKGVRPSPEPATEP